MLKKPSSLVLIVILLVSIFFLFQKDEKIVVDIKTIDKPIITKKLPTEPAKPRVPTIPINQKKQDFKDKLLPAIEDVYSVLQYQYKNIEQLIQNDPENILIIELKKEYKVKTDLDLLMALKPHPKSIALAQSAMESAWATSRFFREANNVFGVWSFNKNEPRIVAGEQRGEKYIYLKKYATVYDSVMDYYKVLSKSRAFVGFRKLNYENQNPYLLVKKLNRYSEKGALYGRELSSMISYNKFTQYDDVFFEKPKARIAPKFVVPVAITVEENLSKIGDIDVNGTEENLTKMSDIEMNK